MLGVLEEVHQILSETQGVHLQVRLVLWLPHFDFMQATFGVQRLQQRASCPPWPWASASARLQRVHSRPEARWLHDDH